MKIFAVIAELQKVAAEHGDIEFFTSSTTIYSSGNKEHTIGHDFGQIDVVTDDGEPYACLVTFTDNRRAIDKG